MRCEEHLADHFTLDRELHIVTQLMPDSINLRCQQGTTTVRVADDWDAVATDDESACAGCIHHIRWTAPYFYSELHHGACLIAGGDTLVLNRTHLAY